MSDNVINFYAGAPPLNRLSFHRQSTEKISAHLNAPNASFILFQEGKPFMKVSNDETAYGQNSEMYIFTREAIEPFLGSSEYAPAPSDPTHSTTKLLQAARLPPLPSLTFLGLDDRPSPSSPSPALHNPHNPIGIPYFALSLPSPNSPSAISHPLPKGGEFQEPRAAASALSPWEASLFAVGRAMSDWNDRNTFCPGCGGRTYSLWGGWKRACLTGLEEVPEGGKVCPSTKGLQNFQYPRTDPVIIMGILNAAGDHILLGRQKAWPKGMYSCLAGFIEPGETFEDAVRREVLEEAGIVVGAVRYSSSQPWPYPANLMVGCFGQAEEGQVIDMTLDNELDDARWFSRSSVQAVLSTPAGSKIEKSEHKKFEDASSSALAPADGKPVAPAHAADHVEGKTEAEGLRFRVPPATAIAGQLIKLWAEGGLEVTGGLAKL